MASVLTWAGRAGWHAITQNRRLLRARQRELLSGASECRILEIGSGKQRRGRHFQSAKDLAPPPRVLSSS